MHRAARLGRAPAGETQGDARFLGFVHDDEVYPHRALFPRFSADQFCNPTYPSQTNFTQASCRDSIFWPEAA
jgi:hypothetical protein